MIRPETGDSLLSLVAITPSVAAMDNLVSVATAERDGVPVVGVAGEIDMATAPLIERELAAQLDRQPPCLILDLRAVSFFGSAGVDVLLHARSRFPETSLRVVAARPVVVRTLRITRLDELFPIHPTLPEAINAVRPLPAGNR